MVGIGAFEFGNVAATLLILRATDLLDAADRTHGSAVQIALGLYALYNLAGTLVSVPAGRLGDRGGMVRVLAAGVACFALAYTGLARASASVLLLAACFTLAGVGIGCAETAEHAAVASFAPSGLRGSAFGLLAVVQSFGNFAASAVAGLLYTVASPATAFAFAAAAMLVALGALAFARH